MQQEKERQENTRISKDNAMLIDIQYVRENRTRQLPDYLYLIWKNLDTGEKFLNTIKEPPVPLYFEKPECRDFDYFKTEETYDRLYKRNVRYKDVCYAVAREDGPQAEAYIRQCLQTQRYRDIDRVKLSKYAFGHDFDIRTIYRNTWMDTYDNDRSKHIHKAFGDIETDFLESPTGKADPTTCPVDMMTIIDADTKEVYTFCLTGVECKEKDTTNMSKFELNEEMKRRSMYAHRLNEQEYWKNHPDELIEEANKMFGENYPGFKFRVYFYTNEAMMITHIFQLIHQLKPDFMLFWNIAFDIPYLIDRCKALGLNPADVMCHPDFPNKQCYFKKDHLHFQIKNKTDFFRITDYTVYIDQMVTYAAIRKGQSELRNNKLTYIAQKEIGDSKLDYTDEATIKTLSYNNWLKYYLYNIKDVFLQWGIENATNDVETLYVYSYENITQYENVFKQTVKLRNLQYRSWGQQGYVPGVNVNAFMYDEEPEEEEDEDEEDGGGKKNKKGFEGALVGNPLLIRKFGSKLYGKRTNNIFDFSIDMDMSSFYPSTFAAMNIYPPCLIFKMKLGARNYSVRGGSIPFNGYTDHQIVKDNDDTFKDDIAKECIDNFVTKNTISFAHKWMNFPSVQQVYNRLQKRKHSIY